MPKKPNRPTQIGIRLFLVGALVLTAHIIKPFSLGNITSHVLHAAGSLSFVLPGQTRDSFTSANLLALSLTNLFFLDGLSGEWSAPHTSDQPLVAVKSPALAQITRTNTARAPRRSLPAPRLAHASRPVIDAAEEATEEAAALSETEEALAEATDGIPAESDDQLAAVPAAVVLPEAHAVVALSPIALQLAPTCAPKLPHLLEGRTVNVRIESLLPEREEMESARQRLIALVDRLHAVKAAKAARITLKPTPPAAAKCETETPAEEGETEATEAPVAEEKHEEIETRHELVMPPESGPFSTKCTVKADM